ncbi:MAG: ORF6N domain-containing protein [Crocinitomicaceae bacterium]|nr:ORF6N domain-containing protein [Crocinitomicaceae bacterium]
MNTELNIEEEIVLKRIHFIRGCKVMLDKDLAQLYQVETKQLKRQVRRNIERFPSDFFFELTQKEWDDLSCHIGTSNWGGSRILPMAFTEHLPVRQAGGVLMLSSVLNNPKAIQVNIQLVRIFTKMRDILIDQKNLLEQIDKIKDRMDHHDDKMDGVIRYLQRFVKDQTIERKPLGYKIKPTKSC